MKLVILEIVMYNKSKYVTVLDAFRGCIFVAYYKYLHFKKKRNKYLNLIETFFLFLYRLSLIYMSVTCTN